MKNVEGKGEIIWRRKINGDANQPGKYSAICLFENYKIEKGRDLQTILCVS